MTCLKCGKEIKDNQVFCPHCLDIMKDYPVKPDVHIHLPHRAPTPVARKSWFKRRSMSTEEQLQHAKKAVRSLTGLVALLTLILVLLGATLAHSLQNQDNPNLGKNYTYEKTGD